MIIKINGTTNSGRELKDVLASIGEDLPTSVNFRDIYYVFGEGDDIIGNHKGGSSADGFGFTVTSFEVFPNKKMIIPVCVCDEYPEGLDVVVVELTPCDIESIKAYAKFAAKIHVDGADVSVYDNKPYPYTVDNDTTEGGFGSLTESSAKFDTTTRLYVSAEAFWWAGRIKHSDPSICWDTISIPLCALDDLETYDGREYIGYGSARLACALAGGYPCDGCEDVNLKGGEGCCNEEKCQPWQIYQDYD